MKIGVFDSGLGGKYVADKLAILFPDDDILYVNDHANMPYGTKTPAQIEELTESAIRPLLSAGCDAIILACNSATTNAIAYLRETHPEQFFIGIEPMIKPAAVMTETGIIAVCATPATLTSSAYDTLKRRYAKDVEIIEPDCATWAEKIENNKADEINVEEMTCELLQKNCDTVVLGCTHYHYLKDRFRSAAPNMHILEPTDAIARRITDQLATVRSRQR